jgi:hypothetical protein
LNETILMPNLGRTHRFALLAGCCCAASLIASCSSEATSPRPGVTATRDIQTDSTHYTLVHLYIYVANIAITFTNRTAQPVTFASCDKSSALFHFEKLTGATWVRPASPTDIPGTYRVVWDGELANPSSSDSRISNTFALSVSP